MGQLGRIDPFLQDLRVDPAPVVFRRPRRAEGPLDTDPDGELVRRYGAAACIRDRVMPWKTSNGVTAVFCCFRSLSNATMARLTATFGEVRYVPSTSRDILDSLRKHFRSDLVRAAETRVRSEESCRSLPWAGYGPLAVCGAVLALFLVVWPLATLLALTGLVFLSMILSAALKLAALLAAPRKPPNLARSDRLPVISILVPLLREKEIAHLLVERLGALDYPAHLLDLCLILEEDDRITQNTLRHTELPTGTQVIVVPRGTVQTKPRALNYALDFAKGEIIGIYDAEDAPSPQQLTEVAAHFAARGPEVACLQGVLDYYNTAHCWMARCFTLEYAAWFRVMLPGLVRLGLVVPLGGTTLFLRRVAIEAVGGWDAHNVTEDADLGLRLARYGYRTEMLQSVTEEEANVRLWPWIRQRSRWLKGYAVTWAVHMRAPGRLYRDLGLWRFIGVQVLFLGTLTQFLLAPLLWTIWPVLLLSPLETTLANNAGLGWGLIGLMTCSIGISFLLQVAGARAAGKASLIPWGLTMVAYFPLATIAAWRGLGQLVTSPFYWEKTMHGQSVGAASIPPLPPSRRRASAA
jgi:cellulose synthase/poly-beta-1,6-N-acetylglucosamine synthase-like glycosyltransferase